jgi:ATP-binding cassette, subfamily B, multidrug efflux pump
MVDRGNPRAMPGTAGNLAGRPAGGRQATSRWPLRRGSRAAVAGACAAREVAVMKELWTIAPFVRPYWRRIALGLALVVVSNAAGVLGPALLGRAIDLIGQEGASLGGIVNHALLIVVVAVIAGAGRFGMRLILNAESRRVETDIRRHFLEHLLRLDAAFYGAVRTGDLMTRATNDTQAVRMAIGPGIMYLVNTIVMTGFVLVFMFSYSLSLTAIALVPLLLLPVVMMRFGRIIHDRFESIQEHFGVLSTMVQENLSGVRIVRAYRQEEAQAGEFRELNRGYVDRNMALARVSAAFHPLLSLLTGIGLLLVLWFGGLQVIDGRLTAGGFVAFGLYLAMLTWPMIALGWVINLFQRGAASMGRLNRILRTEPAIADRPREPAVRTEAESDQADARPIHGEIEFRDVTFRYPGSARDVLHGVSFRIPAGATVAFVGPTGAGKSTIAALLTRRYDPTGGEVLLDGVPLPELPLAVLRGAIGLVPQDAFVFSDTIGENIGLGITGPGTDREAWIRRSADVAQLTEAIATFPRGFDTLLGERGINLSGGQRQRTTLARAIARDPRIIVLDDALSAVDTRTEAAILRGLRDVLRERTAIVISHRVSAVMDADLILVFDDGRIVQQGVHRELIDAEGVYARLLRRQLLEDALESEDGGPLGGEDRLAGSRDRT